MNHEKPNFKFGKRLRQDVLTLDGFKYVVEFDKQAFLELYLQKYPKPQYNTFKYFMKRNMPDWADWAPVWWADMNNLKAVNGETRYHDDPPPGYTLNVREDVVFELTHVSELLNDFRTQE